eukprot:2588542-Rhodomonas_salina.1
MVAQQSKQLNDQSKQIQNLKCGRDGNPKQKESQDSEEIPMCKVPGCCRRHCGECVKNSNINTELKEANKALSKLKSLQLIKNQGSDGKKSSGSTFPCANANSAEISQLEKAKAVAGHLEEINEAVTFALLLASLSASLTGMLHVPMQSITCTQHTHTLTSDQHQHQTLS